jgi:NTP pyrophosphatase (non-canonical NTP hydrolase)
MTLSGGDRPKGAVPLATARAHRRDDMVSGGFVGSVGGIGCGAGSGWIGSGGAGGGMGWGNGSGGFCGSPPRASRLLIHVSWPCMIVSLPTSFEPPNRSFVPLVQGPMRRGHRVPAEPKATSRVLSRLGAWENAMDPIVRSHQVGPRPPHRAQIPGGSGERVPNRPNPASCPASRLVAPSREAMMSDMPLSRMQKRAELISRRYETAFGIAPGEDWIMLKLQEELGELAQAYLATTGRSRHHIAADEAREAVGREIADVVGFALALAERLGIDAGEALERKWMRYEATA